MVDLYVEVAVDRISPEAPVPVMRTIAQRTRPGGAANVAENVLALGCDVELIGVTGVNSSITGEYVVPDPERPTTTKTRFVAPNGQQIARLDEESTSPVSVEIEALLCANISAVMKNADCLVISDYAKGVCTWNVVHWAITCAHEKELPIVVDPKRDNWEIYEGATVITPNEKEWNSHLRNENDCSSFPHTIVTLGERGMDLHSETPVNRSESLKITHFQSKAETVFDVTGAGDTVVAVIAVGLALGLPIEECCCRASVAASLVVGKRGTATVSAEEIEQVMKEIR